MSGAGDAAATPSGRVIAKVRALVAPSRQAEVIDALARYDGESPAGRERVQLAILRLSAHRPDEIAGWVAEARRDFRDVLAPAEYPRQGALGFAGMEALDEAGRARVIAEDLAEYQAWLDDTHDGRT